jgi:DUF1365 family protein
MTFFGFDLAELPALDAALPFFGHNRQQVLRMSDRDFLYGKGEPIPEQLDRLIPPQGEDQRTLLISSPRYFGYAFNPVNFHLRLRGWELMSAVAEVNNTFGDRHVYPLTELHDEGQGRWTADCAKAFHVSPFNNMEGSYRFTFRIEPDSIFIGVDLLREGECVMKTWIEGKSRALNSASIMRYALLHPFDTALNSMPRIVWQAALLRYRRQMEVITRPSPKDAHTLIDRDAKDGPGQVV